MAEPDYPRGQEYLPNGMRVPGMYGVLQGEWLRANSLGHGRLFLYTPAEESPGEQWQPSDDADDRGRPLSWTRIISERDLDRLVDVSVLATWQGLGVGILKYREGRVYAFVDGGPKEDQIRRGEIPEITIAGPGEYHGKFRWEDLSDVVLTEHDLLKVD
ncbi:MULTISPECIES: hypothetical protein [Arthrobacter]|uniref:Uncharacterized protein n=1 Tax=Arthrobacter caoxuetaonis TaxID=2886935 RepID=A0A9X1MCT2_9MICC|nr:MULTISPECIES: hypothetical protein [Arthrobacter]MCC3283839.1 hypothetical protein [Arthrobacter caoxuetaonis]MCC3297166.1 hypothetical protein [Arthrobacter caoxuetaonis]MCC9194055.1 hypothetical protein [Arthrobacter sp. zg-Y916]USQ58274.1 hypothetical protein NF551_05410 [Arthrobacter caoxuetaonis]